MSDQPPAAPARSTWWPTGTAWLTILMQVLVVLVLAGSAWIASDRWQTEQTLKQTDRLADRVYVDALWPVEQFTICFEGERGRHLSYLPSTAVAEGGKQLVELAKEWWALVENENLQSADCGKPADLEHKLLIVYGRLEALAACAEHNLCSYNRFDDVIETMDYLSVLAISNYLLLTREPGVSVGWRVIGSFPRLVSHIEAYAFLGKNPTGKPIFSEAEFEAIRRETTRCHRPPGAVGDSGDWRRCRAAKGIAG